MVLGIDSSEYGPEFVYFTSVLNIITRVIRIVPEDTIESLNSGCLTSVSRFVRLGCVPIVLGPTLLTSLLRTTGLTFIRKVSRSIGPSIIHIHLLQFLDLGISFDHIHELVLLLF